MSAASTRHIHSSVQMSVRMNRVGDLPMLHRFSHAMSATAFGLAATLALVVLGVPSPAAGSSATGTLGCTWRTFAVEPCVGACVAIPQTIAATEIDGVRHVIWLQNQPNTSFFVARLSPDGTSRVESIALPFAGSSAKAIAARGDLLVVGRTAGMAIYRLVDDAWTLEAAFDGFGTEGERIAITIGGDDIERIVTSRTNLAEGWSVNSPVRIYARNPTWALEATLSSGFAGAVGADLAIDGDTLAVGAPSFSSFAEPASGVLVYTRNGSTWAQEATLTFDNGPWTPGGLVGLPSAIGHRVALAGDTLVAMNAAPNALDNTFINGVGSQTGLVVYRRTDGQEGGVWQQTDHIGSPTTRFGMGYELVASEDGDDVLVIATVYRKFAPVIDGLMQFRIRDGVVIEETSIAVPWSEDPSLSATTYGVARPRGGATPQVNSQKSPTWIAVTVPKELDTGIRMIELDPAVCSGSADGDLNGDGAIDGADLGILLSQWGPCVGCLGDLNGDGVVDGADLGILLGNWTSPP